MPEPPDLAALLGLSAAETGGETILMDGVELCRRLDQADPEHVRELSRPHPFDAKGQTSEAKIKYQPIVKREGGEFELRYLRHYIEQGYAHEKLVPPAALIAAMDRFDEEAGADDVQLPVLLERGVLLLWDNRRFLHGRRPFEEGNSHRRLRRMYARWGSEE